MNPSKGYLLDTGILARYIRQDATIMQQVDALAKIFIPSIVIGELAFGAHLSSDPVDGLTKIARVEQLGAILNVDQATGRIYGKLKQEQRAKGLMLPENDLWIAAIALQYGLTLAARDQHFNHVDGLLLEQW